VHLKTLLVSSATAVAMSILGGSIAGADVQLPPGVTLPPRASDTTTTTAAPPTTQPATVVTLPSGTTPTTSAAPTPTTAPTATTVAGPAPETKLILLPPNETKVLTPPGPGGATTTVPGTPGAQSQAATPSLTPGQVDEVLRNLARTGASSTAALVEALRPLQNYGMTLQEALALGMGPFPVLGVATWTDDWLDYRAGPPVHAHQGNDLFAPFDTPVRAPVDGTVRFEDGGLGGKGAFVTAADGTYYYMAHLNSFAKDLSTGAAVKAGQVVGYNGDSGNARGGAPHVHFEIHPRGGAAINPKPILDAWVAEALARVPELLASFEPKPAAGSPDGESGGVPQILVATGMTRRFTAPSQPAAGRERLTTDFKRAVLGPLTPSLLAPLLDPR
jgi:murein DD-endopeptidase MepM/ murein hydrolase activator NlpD